MKTLKRGIEFALTLLIPLSFLYTLLIIAATANTFVFPVWGIVLGTFLAGGGIIIWIISLVNLGRSFGVLPVKQKRVHRGLYRYFNHPMYLGMLCVFTGLSLAMQAIGGIIVTLFFMLPLLCLRAFLEEKKLSSQLD